MKVGIVGSRGPRMPADGFIGCLTKKQSEHVERMEAVRRYVLSLPDDTVVVTGGAAGVDTAAMRAAKERTPRLPLLIYYPDMDKHGRAAGIMQRRRIVHESHRVVAFFDGESRGTGFAIAFAAQVGREILVLP